MSYKYITIGARVAPLDVIQTKEYIEGVRRETALAESAEELLFAL